MDLEIKGIKKSFGRKEVLGDISFTASRGSCIGILGNNGSGKSTLLSILAGNQRCDSGSFIFQGEELLSGSRLLSRSVGYVPQGTPLICELSAYDNLLLWYTREEIRRELYGGVLEMLGIGEFLKLPVYKMSGGMKKRLSIGCATVKKPPILILDEPSSALDISCKARINSYLEEYKKGGNTIIMATHDVSELALCDSLYLLRDGCLTPFTYDGNLQGLAEIL